MIPICFSEYSLVMVTKKIKLKRHMIESLVCTVIICSPMRTLPSGWPLRRLSLINCGTNLLNVADHMLSIVPMLIESYLLAGELDQLLHFPNVFQMCPSCMLYVHMLQHVLNVATWRFDPCFVHVFHVASWRSDACYVHVFHVATWRFDASIPCTCMHHINLDTNV